MFTIRLATPDDAETIAGLIRELAEYEKLAHEAGPDVQALREHLSAGAGSRCEALLAEERTSGRAVGFALFFPQLFYVFDALGDLPRRPLRAA